jgi:hypothetical protein
MALPWIHSPYLDIDYIASKLYGATSRWHSHQLRKKIKGTAPFESWEIEQLNEIKEELLSYLTPGTTSYMLHTETTQQL